MSCIRDLLLVCLFISPGNDYRFAFREGKPLEWKDFKGVADTNSAYAALANTGLSQNYATDQKGHLIRSSLKITAYFYPKLSWYKPEFATQALLEHERTHFAISELFARKLRKKVYDYPFTSNEHHQLDSLYRAIERERLAMQAHFDSVTAHGRNEEQEKIQQDRVKRELKQLKKWASKN